VLDSLGLGYESVKEANPGVVYVTSQGYGREGPLADTPAYGPLNLGFAGLHHLWNHPDAPYPCGTSLNHPDHIAGKFLAVAVLAALRHRARTGLGQLVDLAQTDLAAFLMGEVYLDAHLSGHDPKPQGNQSDVAVPHNVYPAAGDDRWLAIAVPSDAAWARLVEALGWTDDEELESLPGRLARRAEIDARVAEWTRSRPPEEAAALLQEHGVSAVPVMGPEDHHADPHLASRRFIVQLEHPEVGAERHAGNPVRLSRLPQRTARSAPCLGADTEGILTVEFGMSAAEVAALRESGVCR
jgi:benzylsuccinate CoA-transferase BbsF subunit